MYQQYSTAYKHHSSKYGPDTVICYMVGKFYEMYDWIDPKTGDCQTSMKRATSLLGIQLSPKPKAGPGGADGLFAGFPVESIHKQAAILTRNNWTVIIYDQAKDAKGSVTSRNVTRILSPGTHVETASNDAVYIGGIWLEEGAWSSTSTNTTAPSFALTAIDLTTGRIHTYDGSAMGKPEAWTADDAFHFFQVHSPRECIVWWKGDAPSKPSVDLIRRQFGLLGARIQVDRVTTGGLDLPLVREDFLRRMISVKSLLPLREALLMRPRTERVLCALLQHLEEMYPSGTKALHCPERWVPEKNLFLGNQALLQLNMVPSRGEASILGLFEKTLTVFGRRALRTRLLIPSADPEELERRYTELDTVGEFSKPVLERFISILRGISDLPRIHRKFLGGAVNSTDVLNLDQSYTLISQVSELLKGTPLAQEEWWSMQTVQTAFADAFSVEKARSASADQFCFQDSKVPSVTVIEKEIAAIYSKMDRVRVAVEEWSSIPPGSLTLEFRETLGPTLSAGKALMKSLGLSLKSGHPPFSGMEIHTKKSGSTLEIPELNSLFHALQAKRLALQEEVRRTLPVVCDEVAAVASDIWVAIEEWVANIDVTYTLWRISKDNGYVRPVIVDEEESFIDIVGLRHPLIESAVSRIEYVKHSVALGSDESAGWLESVGWLVYGMNASGKSSLMKAVGIAVLLAQAGCFVPAEKFRFAPFKSLFTRILNTDNLWAGLSSFAVEMMELREILQRADSASLVLGDELCSGTESVSATALVGAGLECLYKRRAKFIFATHLHGLQDIPCIKALQRMKVWHLKVRYDIATDRLIYERTLTPGAGSSLYGLEVAKAMGLPDEVLQAAHGIRRGLLGTATGSDAPISQWNTSVQRKECEVCHKAIIKDLEVHHIRERAEATDGLFADGTNQDSLRNLVVVCTECHDKHHAGTIKIGGVVQTSDGPVREITTTAPANTTQRSKKWSPEQYNVIEQYLREFPNCPPTRIVFDLFEKEGIQISVSALRTMRKSIV